MRPLWKSNAEDHLPQGAVALCSRKVIQGSAAPDGWSTQGAFRFAAIDFSVNARSSAAMGLQRKSAAPRCRTSDSCSVCKHVTNGCDREPIPKTQRASRPGRAPSSFLFRFYASSLANASKCSSSCATSTPCIFAQAKMRRSGSGTVTPDSRPRSASRIARSHVSAVIG